MLTFNTSSFSTSISDSDYGIPAPAIKLILIPYLFSAVVLGLLGNGIVIRSTFSVNVWKFDETLTTLLRYLAMTDAGLTIFHILPQSISLFADSWILKEAGIIIAFVRYPLFMMEMSLVLALSLAKLFMILRPCNCHSDMLLATKIISPLIFLFFLIIDYSKIVRCFFNENTTCYSYYKPNLLRCSFKTDDRFGGLLKIIYGLIVMGLLILTNLAILFFVWKAQRERPAGTAFPGKKGGMKAIVVVSTVCWIFMISYLPFLLISKHLNIHPESEIVKFASEQLVTLNIVANPVIYTLLYKSFSEHVAKSLKIGRTKERVVHIALSGVEAAHTPVPERKAEGLISSSVMYRQSLG